jgi:oligoribonuclease NrnB/cAMP/cGMP phosphodiesterase (DHH superfamily)
MPGPQIVTHGDFDGIVSAALVGLWTRQEFVFFTGPESLRGNPLGAKDIVCDLPHPAREVRAWFDHHQGNIDEAKQMGWSAGEGAAYEAPSAARVIFEHLKGQVNFPEHVSATVDATDRVDSMAYATIDEWLAETPENVINGTIFLPGEDIKDARKYLWRLVSMVRRHPLGEIVEFAEVIERHRRAAEHAKRAAETIARVGEAIAGGEICVLDFSEMKVTPRFSKNLAYTVFPRARAVLSLAPVVQGGRKTNDLRLSLSLNPFVSGQEAHNCAAILDQLEIGGGHVAAAGGKITASSKDERLRAKAKVLEVIARLWGKQKNSPVLPNVE